MGQTSQSQATSTEPYRVFCVRHGPQFLSHEEYIRQLDAPNDVWRCPHGCVAEWDDTWYESWLTRLKCLETVCDGVEATFYTPDGDELTLCGRCPMTATDLDSSADIQTLLSALQGKELPTLTPGRTRSTEKGKAI